MSFSYNKCIICFEYKNGNEWRMFFHYIYIEFQIRLPSGDGKNFYSLNTVYIKKK